jgi:recombination protein RecA
MAKKTDKKSGDVPAAGGGKSQALQLAVDQIEKQFGKGSIMRLGENHTADIETTPTGSISLDLALGGGIPRGRIIEIYGPESSGKTTVCLHAVAEVQKSGGTAAYVDAEHALDPAYAKKIGVDTNNLLYVLTRWISCS